ncbi:MAG: SMP-30/gluconolactonase/LRE family protein [Armatimonadota bacterium]
MTPPAPPPAAIAPPATALAYSPDGKTLAVGTFRAVHLRDTATGRRRTIVSGPADAVRALAYSPDGTRLAIAGGVPTASGEVLVVDTATGKIVRTLREHRDPVHAVAWLDGGKRLATASGDRTLRLWNPATGACLKVLKDHADSVQGVAASPDGSRLCSTGVDRSIKVWDARTGRALFTFSGRAHADTAYTLQFSPSGDRLLSAGGDRVAKLWTVGSDADATRVWRTLGGHGDAVHAAAFSPDGLHIATASADKGVGLWSGPGGGFLRRLEGAKDWVYAVAFSPDGKRVAAGTYDGAVLEWDPATGTLRRTADTLAETAIELPEPPAPAPQATGIAKVADGLGAVDGPAFDGKGMVFVGDREGEAITRVDGGGNKTKQFRRDDTKFTFERTGGQTYFEDGSLFACDVGRNAVVRVYVDQRQELVAEQCAGEGFRGPRDLAFDPAGSLYLTDQGGSVFRIAAGNRRTVRVASGLADPAGLAFTADGKTLVVVEAGTGQLWRYPVQPDGTLGERTALARIAPDLVPGGAAFDIAGNLLVAVRGGVQAFDPSGKPLATIAFPGRVTNVEFGGKGLKTLFATLTTPAADGKPGGGELWKATWDIGGLPLFRAPRTEVQ